MKKQRRPLPQSSEQEWPEDQQSQSKAGTVYSKGDMKVTVFDTTPDRDVYMRISCRGVARNIRLQRSDPEGALLARFGPELGADMIRVIQRRPGVNRRKVSRKFFEAIRIDPPETE